MVTNRSPVVPLPTMARISVSLTTEKLAAGVPPRLTAVVPVKLTPLIVMVSPIAAFVGKNELITGEQLMRILTL